MTLSYTLCCHDDLFPQEHMGGWPILCAARRGWPASPFFWRIAPAQTEKYPANKIFPTACRIPDWPFDVVVKAGEKNPA
jgi:hypothetical protein